MGSFKILVLKNVCHIDFRGIEAFQCMLDSESENMPLKRNNLESIR